MDACWDPPRNNLRWSTNRLVLYSAGLYDLFTRLYKGQACCPIGQFAIQQAAGEKYVVQPPGVVSGRCRQRRMRYPLHPANISNSANSLTMELGFDLCRLNPCTAEQDGKELGDHRRKSHSDTLPKCQPEQVNLPLV
jgi:hypothetical protein